MMKDPKKRIKIEDALKHKWFELFAETKIPEDLNELKLRKIKSKIDNIVFNAENSLLFKK
jgi:hypothetical protein